VGETARYSVMARMSDGSERDVTNEAQWYGSDAVSISGPGLVTGRVPGVAELTAVVGGQRVPGRVTVLPAGTYRLGGRVHETDAPYPWVGVTGAQVDVTTGTGARLSTFTGSAGEYRFDGVGGEVTLLVTKDGYQSVEAKFGVAFHRTYDIELPLLTPRADVSGLYTLTVAAADQCAVGLGQGHLPEEARVRTYTAAVRQDGPTLRLTLGGATFCCGSEFIGKVVPGGIEFFFPWGDGNEWPYVAEHLPASRFFFMAGNVVAAGSARRFAGVLSGDIRLHETSIFAPAIAWCSSTTHQVVLSR
jgi:hypothetical protein